mmetsp:Transcript_275/g.560  ORF Transcript_275/g.560 Transcript_275/m.560 type:complete len:314 (-) Transcript_275:55-996(-)
MTPDPKSPSRLKDRFKGFFRRKSKKVTFDISRNQVSLVERSNGGASSQRSVNRGRSPRRRRLRKSLLKKLRRGGLKRNSSGSSSPETKNAGDATAGAESTPTAPLQVEGNDLGDQQCSEDVGIEADDMDQSPLPPRPPPAAEARTDDTTMVRNDTASLNSMLGAISLNISKSTITSIGSNSGKTFDNSNSSYSLGDRHSNSADEDYGEAISAETNIETSSGSNYSGHNTDASSNKHSIYIGDIIHSLPTNDSSGIPCEESWVETILSRFTKGELNELLDGNLVRERSGGGGVDGNASLAGSSAKISLAGYNFV